MDRDLPNVVNLMNTIPGLSSYETVYVDYVNNTIVFKYISSSFRQRDIYTYVQGNSYNIVKPLDIFSKSTDVAVTLGFDQCLKFQARMTPDRYLCSIGGSHQSDVKNKAVCALMSTEMKIVMLLVLVVVIFKAYVHLVSTPTLS